MRFNSAAATPLAASTAMPGSAPAAMLSIELTNLAHGTYFTPLMVVAHDVDGHLFQVATPASANLQAMAEGGDLAGLVADVAGVGVTYVANPAGGLLAPGASVTVLLDSTGTQNTRLSVVGMLLPTDDGFVDLDSLPVPTTPGAYTYYLNGYNAGTDTNDEIINGGGAPGVPGIALAPGGDGGTGGTGAAGPDVRTTMHIHRAVLGDTDPAGEFSVTSQ